MKKLIISLLITTTTFAIQGVVKVLEAPLFLEEDTSSIILQNHRKGKLIFINDNSLGSAFYKTITNDGHDAYIQREYIKLIHNNLNELESNISMENDPTDYILEEPLPSSYPFSNRLRSKASAHLSFNQGNSSYYDYPLEVQREQINPAGAIELKYFSRAKFDVENRLYYGFQVGAVTSRNEFQLQNKIFTTEVQSIFQGGPIVTYTFYRRKSFEIDSSIHFSFNYHRTFVKQERIEVGESEEKLFTGFSVSAVLSTMFIHKSIGKRNEFDFIHGPSLNLSPGHTLSTTTPSEFISLWDTDTTSSPAKVSLSYSFGVLHRF